MAKIKLPSGRTVTVNFDRAVEQVKKLGIDLEGAPPDDVPLRTFVDALATVGLDLDSTFADLEAMMRAFRDHEDRRDNEADADAPA